MIRKEILILLIISILLFLGATIFYFSGTLNSPALNLHPVLEECNSLIYNGENSINLLIFGEEKESLEYANYFLKTPPFEEYSHSFNFYYITPESYKPTCKIFQGIATLCYSKELIKKAASCPNIDHIIVLDEQPGEIRSSSYLNVMSINKAHPLTVLIHEFGHSFANLAEEYKTNQAPVRKSENCQSSCDDFTGEINGCFQECSKSNYYRTINSGIMRTLSNSDYGLYNQNLIIKLIEKKIAKEKTITGKATTDNNPCTEQSYYLIEARKINKGLEVIDKSIQTGCPENPQDIGEGTTYDIYSPDSSLALGKIRNEIFTDNQEIINDEGEIEGYVFDSSQEGETFILTASYKEKSTLELVDADTGQKIIENLEGSTDFRGNLACHL
ncbi:hypothetical protein AUJ84_00810 [Candidatus Pacearchaeota archaeon CG1_02_32_132]|nr:MAG: hypothetical protein AUJ84_00810 [Candidatus Pacearchaeota archaeon CG1_02_32_132]